MEDNKILTKLRENNPFVSSASPLPWDNKNPDLLQLSREAAEDIEQLMRHKRREPSIPLAGLILGEAGAGKTHMLTRILRRLRGSSVRAVFVAVRTFRDHESVTKHLLDEIFISLKQIHSSGRTQFDIIMSEFAASYQEHRRQEDYALDIRSQVAKDIPGLDRNFLKCFISYLSVQDAATKNDLLEWLINGLPAEDAMRLGLPERDLNSMSNSRREQEAEKVLIALGHILAYSKVLMIVCFDQMDGMRSRELISAWGNIINLLMNDLSGILPLCFIRSEIWNDVFMPVLDDAVISRLRNNTMIMRTCTLEQAKLLIRAKIEAVFGKDAKEIYNWLINQIGKKLFDGYSPRSVIELANHAITATGEIDGIKKAYEDEYKKVQREQAAWPPKLEHLALAFETWLSLQENFQFTVAGQDLRATRKYYGENFAFAVVTPQGIRPYFVANRAIEYLINFLENHKNSCCYYISEASIHKDTWKTFETLREKFEKLGGHVLLLDEHSRVQWYALVALIDRIDNGDVNLYLPSGKTTATRDDIKKFVKENINLVDLKFNNHSTEKKSVKNSTTVTPDTGDASVVNILSSMLDASPMKMLSVKKVLELLEQRNIKMTDKKLMSLLKLEKSFKIYKNEDDDPLITFSEQH